MMHLVEELFHQALDDGYEGLWGTGDMTWEMGAEKDPSKLLEYERRLDEFYQEHPQFGVICQYHADTLPHEMMRQGLLAHRAVFISERLSLLNPYYVRPESFFPEAADNSRLDLAIRDSADLEAPLDRATLTRNRIYDTSHRLAPACNGHN